MATYAYTHYPKEPQAEAEEWTVDYEYTPPLHGRYNRYGVPIEPGEPAYIAVTDILCKGREIVPSTAILHAIEEEIYAHERALREDE